MNIFNHLGESVVTTTPGMSFPLPAQRVTWLFPLVFTTIPHGLYIKDAADLALILPKKGVFMSRSLWIGVERAEGYELVTHVFNMSKTRVRLIKGESISELVVLGGDREPQILSGDPRPIDLRTFDSPS